MVSQFVADFKKALKHKNKGELARNVTLMLWCRHEWIREERWEIAKTMTDKNCTKRVFNYLSWCKSDAACDSVHTNARTHLYKILMRLTFDNDDFRVHLTESRIPMVIGQHLQHLQEIHKESMVSV